MDAKLVGLGRSVVVLPFLGLVLLAAIVGVACGSADPEPTPPPAATATTVPTPEPAPEPSPEPTPTEIAVTLDEPAYVVVRDDLPLMILTPDDVALAIPEIRRQLEDLAKLSGGGLSASRAFIDNNNAARASADLLDTAASLAERGRIVGYQDRYFNASALYATGGMPAGPFQVFTGVQWFDTAESASAWLDRSLQNTRDSVGQTQNRFTIMDFLETPAPDLGDQALIERSVGVFSGPPSIETTNVLLRWRRGQILAAVQVTTINDESYTGAALGLALTMDAQINAVLAGPQ
jgi:hypothetical protein